MPQYGVLRCIAPAHIKGAAPNEKSFCALHQNAKVKSFVVPVTGA
jgi:hypothetical protein